MIKFVMSLVHVAERLPMVPPSKCADNLCVPSWGSGTSRSGLKSCLLSNGGSTVFANSESGLACTLGGVFASALNEFLLTFPF